MRLDQTKLNWERLGEIDPMFAILSDPELEGNRWDVDAFLRTGEEEVAQNLDHLARLGVEVARQRCLDFGCGVGRLTQALCRHFDRCDGVDIAASMIERAREMNRHGERCRYHVNARDDLALFEEGTFDFVMSLIVLQHVEPLYAKRYIADFMRVLRPGGAALFQVPAAPTEAGGRALPEGAHRASLVADGVPANLVPGQPVAVSVTVRNTSTVNWPANHRLRVGNHWRYLHTVVVLDDGRTAIPGGLEPGQETTVEVTITPPAGAGRHELEFDVVEEGVSWFGDRGSTTTRVPVKLLGQRDLRRLVPAWMRLGPGRRVRPKPVMEMHCVPLTEVLETVAEAGGEVVDISRYDVSSPNYESYRYVAVKR
jgi:SAM-dependent methyltransferase